MSNHLAAEKSPYLLQHANNPVDWYPWGEAAFEKARAEGKPIFLSVGYSTCHWCHVMAHESFENEAIARVLNANFVPVKVDREERPDVDRVYMTFVQATTESGGWPMSVWLTPQLEPFYGGTYFPPAARWGRPGFIDILEEIARAWREDPDRVRRSAAEVIGRLKRFATAARGERPLSEDAGGRALGRAVAELRAAFDVQHGGFGGAPKFPRPSELLLLFREFARRGETEARDMALQTLDAMSRGGIHDHVGGGFHRYSVDAGWHVPHFEKMLYDQAQLALAFLEAFQITGEARFAQVARATLQYTRRDLARPGGGFYSAEDADSVPYRPPANEERLTSNDQGLAPGTTDHVPGTPVEGAFYVWTDEEFGELLGDDADLARLRFGVRPRGNVAVDPHGEFAGKNVLYLARSIGDVAREVGQTAGDVEERLQRVTRRLLDVRARRSRPGLDDKVIAAWNGLAIAAFARASRVLPADATGWLDAARDAARFVRGTMWDPARRRLLRRYREGQAAFDGYAEDFACLVFGLLELFQADGDPAWLDWAILLQQVQDELFWDDANGGWFSTTGEDRSVLLRLKEEYDGAEPAASSVALWNLMTLARLTGDETWMVRVERTLSAFSSALEQAPRAMPMTLAALSTFLAPRQEIVIVGAEGNDDTAQFLERLAALHLPFAVIVPVSPERQAAVARLLPFVGPMRMREGRATAYVCRNFACSRPTTDPDEMVNEIVAAK